MPKKNDNNMLKDTKKEKLDQWVKDYMEIINADYDKIGKMSEKYNLQTYIANLFRQTSKFESYDNIDPAAKIALDGANKVSDQFLEEFEEDEVFDGVDAVANMKKAYFGALQASYDATSESKIANDATYMAVFAGENNIFKEMVDILKDGDQIGRGSSNEYKEIQRDLKELNSLVKTAKFVSNPAVRKYVQVMTSSIAERASKYIENREKRELNVAVDSYQGKRIQCMRQVSSRLQCLENRMNNYGVLLNGEKDNSISADYRKMISKKISETTFTSALFTQAVALHELGNNATYAELIQKVGECHNHPVTEAITSGLRGIEISEKKQIACWNIAVQSRKKNLGVVRNAIQSKNPDQVYKLVASVRNLEEKIDREDNNSLKQIMDSVDNVIYEKPKYTFQVTGYKAVDRALFHQMKEEVEKAPDELQKVLAEDAKNQAPEEKIEDYLFT